MRARHLLLSMVAFTAAACGAAAPRPTDREPASARAGLAYADLGNGSPVLLVHGAYGDLRTFRRALPILSAAHRVIVPSLRYHWPNPWPGDPVAYRDYTVENHARDLAELIVRLGVGPVDVVAHSYGGNVAVILARTRPDLVRRLVLAEPAVGWLLREVPGGEELLAKGPYGGGKREALIARARAEEPVSVMRALIDGDKPGSFDAVAPDSRMQLVDNARLVGPYATRPAFNMPFTCMDARGLRPAVLLVRGEKTADAFRQTVERFAACVPEARTIVLPGSTHVIQRDAPEELARVVVEFLAR